MMIGRGHSLIVTTTNRQALGSGFGAKLKKLTLFHIAAHEFKEYII